MCPQIQSRRLKALFLVLLFVSSLFLSAVFLAREADHDCHGEDCAICAQLTRSRETVRGTFASGRSALFVLPAQAYALTLVIACFAPVFCEASPVSRKTRMNN